MTKVITKQKDSGFGKAKLLPGNFRAAAIQMASGPHVDANLLEAGRLMKMAANQGAAIIGLPEYFAIMGMKEMDKVKVAESFGAGPIQDFLSRSAKRLGVWIIGGSIPLKSDQGNKIRNSCLVYDHKGQCVARYDKIHLFDFQRGAEKYDESKTIEPGHQVVTLDSPFGKIGLSICYDLRFPELYRAMGDCDLIFVPSAFTETTGKAHWETLIRARAIENLSYVIAPAQGGYHMNGRETHGSSMIVDPWGVVLDRLQRGSGVVIAGVNPIHINELRTSLPALQHRTLSIQAQTVKK
ncbi:MAG: acyltransferase [Ferrovum sp. 37-45-19]|uniref:carbon-nitrogen hydrolase family protein n=1 Tax=Ferrovum sp. JA12 TaxID=1356299 RepID=UPI000702E7F5|nr:carbon-nitrogen hydrolase family protein [Ferrovum sp. JA12]KRH78862.1 2-oxoglutaramate amidase [Ferrovum sp. JA12]OYV80183.1 MAG: acyltransferase [Ferrovum sp. 21-44-67]OYV94460.1 MAG: acyltransferase [Ferrovum sp. 37-45-19]OZB32442.1 MAG: acyltransferase [Ferrovum sp. 34-44-207]